MNISKNQDASEWKASNRSGTKSEVRLAIENLEVGQGFEVSDLDEKQVKSIRSACTSVRRQGNRTIHCSVVADGHLKIWRSADPVPAEPAPKTAKK